jgi:hypothetical protein
MRLQVHRMAKVPRRVATATIAVLSVLLVMGGMAYAAITTPDPTTLAFVVPSDAAGHPLSFTVAAGGFPQGPGAVNIEQCDGVSPSTPNYDPNLHCDAATSPAAVDVGADGVATFTANDPNFGFFPFEGASPQKKFNCMAPGEKPVYDGAASFPNCQVRVATDLFNTNSTDTYLTLVLPTPTGNASVGGCGGQVGVASFADATTKLPISLTDQTALGVVVKGKMLKNIVSKAALGGNCSAPVRAGDVSHPAGGVVALTPKALSLTLLGNISCAATPAGPNAASAWPANGKLAFTMNELDATAHFYSITTQVSLARDTAAGPDVYDVSGVVVKGPGLGGTVSGAIWMDPVVLAAKGVPGLFNSGYQLDTANVTHCNDATVGNASTAAMLFGGGGASATSPRGAVGVTGIVITLDN